MLNRDLSTAIKNSSGEVALCHTQTNNPLVELGSYTNNTYRAYRFNTQHNICLAWVKEEDAQRILNITKHCCGNSKTHPYYIASETDIRRWTFGGR